MPTVTLDEKKQHLLEAMRFAKTKGATAIKIELEALLGRGSASGGNCDCSECVIARRESGDSTYWGDEECLNSILDDLGIPEDRELRDGHGHAEMVYSRQDNRDLGAEHQWLQYAEFYNDGSVDSELTITVRLDNEENAFKALDIIEAFKHLAEKIGNGMNVDGAGLHTAFLFTPTCTYPSRYNTGREVNFTEAQLTNFRAAMTHMLPALYFLAAPANGTNSSRSLHFRAPNIGVFGNKYSAIHVSGGAIEFRVFDTCYDVPEQMVDNLIVMGNSLKYLSDTYCGPTDRVTSYNFGNDRSRKLDRLYMNENAINLLYKHIDKLKPPYYGIRELRLQRGLNITRSSVKKLKEINVEKAELAWQEYEERWKMLQPVIKDQVRMNAIRKFINSAKMKDISKLTDAEIEGKVKEEIEEHLDHELSRRESKRDYCRRVSERLEVEYRPEINVRVPRGTAERDEDLFVAS